jgi:formamidopyrimidine-DNA glycosylase
MPELPEAEIARRQLERWLADHPIERVVLTDPASVRSSLSSKPSDAVADPEAAVAGWVGARLTRSTRHGKRIGAALGEGGFLLHLGMSGKLLRTDGEVPAFGRIGLAAGGGTVWLVDRRRFGCVVAVPAAAIDAGLREGHGPDALDAPLDGPGLAAALRTKLPVKVALMDQERLAGLGNIQAAEALFAAAIDPRTSSRELTSDQWTRLAAVIPERLRAAIADDDGETITYVNEGGQNRFAVYGREGEPCPRCGRAIAAITQAGRSTYFCPGCQGAPPA